MKRYGLIGHPVGHSRSKTFYDSQFAKLGLDCSYHLFDLSPLSFDRDVTDLLATLDGANVTMPYKVSIMPFLDYVDPVASAIGAVNVIKRVGERWWGFNTDYVGFGDSFSQFVGPSIAGERVLVLGTGGVSRAVQYALRAMGYGFGVVSRGEGADYVYSDIDERTMRRYSVFVNCTLLGMGAHEGECPCLPYEYLQAAHYLYDCIYEPARTAFLSKGERVGCSVCNGLAMFHSQAENALKIWLTE